MAKLPALGYRKVVKAFESFGWEVVRKESHVIMTRDGSTATLSVPAHPWSAP